jgi:uncharacterized membrane protein YeaQ/YmgE (transglycosylase-associated protein family)
MEIFSWAVVGLIAAVVEEMTMPSENPRGLISALLIGVASAVTGAFIAAQRG